MAEFLSVRGIRRPLCLREPCMLNQTNPVNFLGLIFYIVNLLSVTFSNIIFNIVLSTFNSSTSRTFLWCLWNKVLYAFQISVTCAPCPTPIVSLILITLLIFGEACALRSSSLCHFLRITLNFFILGPNILEHSESTLFLDHNLFAMYVNIWSSFQASVAVRC